MPAHTLVALCQCQRIPYWHCANASAYPSGTVPMPAHTLVALCQCMTLHLSICMPLVRFKSIIAPPPTLPFPCPRCGEEGGRGGRGGGLIICKLFQSFLSNTSFIRLLSFAV